MHGKEKLDMRTAPGKSYLILGTEFDLANSDRYGALLGFSGVSLMFGGMGFVGRRVGIV